MLRSILIFSGIMLFILFGAIGYATVPSAINYQGVLLNSEGNPVTAGQYQITFRIYDAAAKGAVLFEETKLVDVSSAGSFNSIVGEVPLVGTMNDALNGEERYLGITIGTTDSEISPRTKLVSSAYSLRVNTVDGAEGGTIRGGLVVEGSAAKLAFAEIKLIGSLLDTIQIGSDDGVILRATNQNGVQVFNSNIDPGTNSAVMEFRGPAGDESVLYSSDGIEMNSSTVAKALSKRIKIHPNSGFKLFSKFNSEDIIAEFKEETDGHAVISMTKKDVSGFTKGSVKLAAPDDDVESEVLSVKDGNDEILLKASVKSTDGAKMDFYKSSGSRLLAHTVTIGSKGLLVLDEIDPSDTLIELRQTLAGEPEFRIKQPAAAKGTNSYLLLNHKGLYITDNSGADTNVFLSADGDVIGKGQIAMGFGSNWGEAKAIRNWSTVFGYNNTASGDSSGVLSGYGNLASGNKSVICGGAGHVAAADKSFIGGGWADTIASEAFGGGILAGEFNFVEGQMGIVCGGVSNHAGDSTNPYEDAFGFVGAGIGNKAISLCTAIPGGWGNVANGWGAAIPGGFGNHTDGNYSFAAGRQAKAIHHGTFVWADSTNADFESTANNQFLIRAGGGVGIGTNSPSAELAVAGDICYTGTIAACSDKRFKKHVSPLRNSLDRILQLKAVNYEWKRDEYPDRKFAEGNQIGFIAQDVEEILPEIVQHGDDGYLSIDYGRLTPVLVDAIKELKADNDELMAEIAKMESEKNAEIYSLKAQLSHLTTLIETVLANQTSGSDKLAVNK